MTIYEIDTEIMSCFDTETGEVIDAEKLEALSMDKEHKIENILLWKKELDAEAEAIANEIKTLTERKKAAENKSESLKKYVKYVLAGERFKTARVAVSYRATTSTEIDDEAAFMNWALTNNRDDLLTYKAPTISKSAVKESLDKGDAIPFAHLEKKSQIIIK